MVHKLVKNMTAAQREAKRARDMRYRLRVKNRVAKRVAGPGLSSLNGLAKRMVFNQVLGFEDACSYVYIVLLGGTAPGPDIRKWNAFFRLLAELRKMPSDGYLGRIAGIAFTKSGGSARYLAAKGAVAVALDAFYGKPFVDAGSIASVLNQMVHLGKNEGLGARVSYIIRKFLIPRMERDIPKPLRIKPGRWHYMSVSAGVATVYDTPRQARLYDEHDISKIASGLNVLSTSIPAHVKILETVCHKIPYLFILLIQIESQKDTRRGERLTDLIKMYRKLCTRVTTRLIDREVWHQIRALDDFGAMRVFLKDTLVDPAHLSGLVQPSTLHLLQERVAANASNHQRTRVKSIARKWQRKTAR